MNLQELLALRRNVDAQIEAERLAHRQTALTEIRNLMTAHGLTVADLTPKANQVAVKYRDAAGRTWTGRGKQPVWLRDALASGATLESFAV